MATVIVTLYALPFILYLFDASGAGAVAVAVAIALVAR